MAATGQIDYIEFPAIDIGKARKFYIDVFAWKFEDYGPDYTSFTDGRPAGRRVLFRPARRDAAATGGDLRRKPGSVGRESEIGWRRHCETGVLLSRRPALPFHGPERERAGRLVGPQSGIVRTLNRAPR